MERARLVGEIQDFTEKLASRRALVHRYAAEKYYELKYSSIPSEVFSRTRARVDERIGKYVPDAIKRFTSVYDNLLSDNPEDWSNAVHSCRRILQSLADALFPAQEDRTTHVNNKSKVIKLGADAYINRLIAYVEDKSTSERFNEIVGSQLSFLGHRLDAIFQATQKGSHASVDRPEADRYVAYTYLIVGDLLSLTDDKIISAAGAEPPIPEAKSKAPLGRGEIEVSAHRKKRKRNTENKL